MTRRQGKQSRWNPNRKRSPKIRHLSKLSSLVRRPRRVERLVASSRCTLGIQDFFFFSFIFIFLREGSLDRGTYVDRVTRCIHLALLGHVSMGTCVVAVVVVFHAARTHTGDREHAQTPFIPTASLHRNTNALRPRLFY